MVITIEEAVSKIALVREEVLFCYQTGEDVFSIINYDLVYKKVGDCVGLFEKRTNRIIEIWRGRIIKCMKIFLYSHKQLNIQNNECFKNEEMV